MPKVRFVDGQNYAAHIRYQQFCTATNLYMGPRIPSTTPRCCYIYPKMLLFLHVQHVKLGLWPNRNAAHIRCRMFCTAADL